jgi:hypothetical protein
MLALVSLGAHPSDPAPHPPVVPAVAPCSTAGVAPGPSRLGAQGLRQDLDVLWDAIEEAHGNPFGYVDRDTLRAAFEEAMTKMSPMSEPEFAAVVGCLLGRMRDGHTRAYPSQSFMDSLSARRALLPFKVSFAGEQLVIVAARAGVLPIGAEVVGLDGRPIQTILHLLRPLLPIDGHAASGREWLLAAQFDLLYSMFIGRRSEVTVRYRIGSGPVREQRVAAIAIADTVSRPTGRNSPPISLRVDSLMAVLRIATFSADELTARRLEFDTVIDSVFTTLRESGARNLIIDLRGNDGGRDTYGAHLLAHLMPDSFSYYRELTTRAESVSFHRLTLNLDSTFNRRFASGLLRRPDGRFRFPESRHANLRRQGPHAPSFDGRVWLLIDGGSNSTTAEFAAVARQMRGVRVVGQESGGVQEGNTSGSFAILVLPTSRLRIVLPLVRYELAGDRPRSVGRGVPPDIAVVPTVDDVIGRTDTALQTVINEIRKGGAE